jgi:hypothetical protein
MTIDFLMLTSISKVNPTLISKAAKTSGYIVLPPFQNIRCFRFMK